jgi:hypothetical protein
MPFQVKDKNGVQIFLRDTVKYEAELDDMGLLGDEEGTALLFPEEGTVQVQSLNGGTPVMMQSDKVEVTYSLVQKITALGGSADLQELINNAEIRYDKAVAATKKPRKSAKAKAEAKPNPFAAVAKKED